MKINKIKKILIYTLIDITLICLLSFSNYYFMYLMPRKEKAEVDSSIEELKGSSKDMTKWQEDFKDKFSNDSIIKNSTSYKSPNVSITISNKIFVSKDTASTIENSELDKNDLNKNALNNNNKNKLGTLNYYVADIYISNLNCLKTHFAESTYGTGFSESILDMANNNNAILAINGDSYSYNKSKNMQGLLVRNGTVYKSEPTDSDVCILYKDGTMKTYTSDEYKNSNINYDDVYNTWIFGPCLLDKSGKKVATFNTSSYIKQRHPRTAIGYFAPGHYCFVVADGRGLNENDGMYLEELSEIFENLGCKSAYNLDGGHCSFMTYDNNYVNKPSNKSTKITDGIFIEEAD